MTKSIKFTLNNSQPKTHNRVLLPHLSPPPFSNLNTVSSHSKEWKSWRCLSPASYAFPESTIDYNKLYISKYLWCMSLNFWLYIFIPLCWNWKKMNFIFKIFCVLLHVFWLLKNILNKFLYITEVCRQELLGLSGHICLFYVVSFCFSFNAHSFLFKRMLSCN